MAATTVAIKTQKRNEGAKYRLKAAAEKIPAGVMVMMNNAGFAANAAAEASNTTGVIGIATETVDNSGGSAGDERITVIECEALMAATSLEQEDVGNVVYASDNQTIDETQASNAPAAGWLTEMVSASQGWVKVGFGLVNDDLDTDT